MQNNRFVSNNIKNLLIMKNLFLSLVFILVGSFTFANNTKEVKKETSKQKITKTVVANTIKVYCDGVYVGTYTCNRCTTQELINGAIAMCG